MYTNEDILAASRSEPFVPFIIHLADQRHFEVTYPNTTAFAEDNRTFLILKKGFHILDVSLVTGIDIPMKSNPPATEPPQ